MDGICRTCLSRDRRLLAVSSQILEHFCSLELKLLKTVMVCFECRSRLNGFVQFRSRALRANKVLSSIPSADTPVAKISDVQCLSTLTRTTISPYNTIVVNGDSVRVKLEPTLELPVQEERVVVTVGPLSMPSKVKANGICVQESKTDEELVGYGDDDLKSDAASEDGEGIQSHYRDVAIHCTTKQMTLSEVLSHLERKRSATRFTRAQYKCRSCALTFTSEAKYRGHARQHSPSRGNLECDVCERRYKDEDALKRHKVGHFIRYACRHCPRSCYRYKQMCLHYRNVHDSATPRPCPLCPDTFNTKRELKQHRRRAHGRRHPCDRCDREYATSIGLQRHSLVHDVSVPELECEICHKKYKGECNLKIHIQGVHNKSAGGADAYCTECDMRFKTRGHYRRHLASGRHVPVEDYQFECDYCGQRCVQKMTLRTHIEQMHLRLSRYKCDVCHESFHTSWVLLRHRRLRHVPRPAPGRRHACYICDKVFRLRKSLSEHMNTHLGKRPFHCKLCSATFAYSAALYNHNQLVHLKKKRGKCSS